MAAGDFRGGRVIRLCRIPYCISMPTAISRVYTNEGFVVAADGRAQNSETGESNDSTQKIFLINKPGIALAYSLAGTVVIGPKNSNEIIFNFYRELSRTIESGQFERSRPKTLHELVRLYANDLHGRLCAAMKERPDTCFLEEKYQRRETDRGGGFRIVQIFFDGYHRGVPSRAHVDFWHVNQKLRKPDPFPDDLDVNVGRVVGYGSEKVSSRLSNNSFKFRKYRLPRQNWTDRAVTLAEGIQHARDFIEAHKSEEARQIDEEMCSAVGGHIHIATVTRSDGAAWVPGFEPVQDG